MRISLDIKQKGIDFSRCLFVLYTHVSNSLHPGRKKARAEEAAIWDNKNILEENFLKLTKIQLTIYDARGNDRL
jgi:GTP cyclohydrolase FolE2